MSDESSAVRTLEQPPSTRWAPGLPVLGPHPRFDARPARHMRIALLSDAARGRNGVGTYYADLVSHLRDHVGRIRMITPPAPGRSSVGGWSIPLPGDTTQRLRMPHVPRVRRQVRALAPDLIISATPGPYGLLGRALAAWLGVPHAFAYHTELNRLVDLYWDGRGFSAVYRAALRTVDRLLLRSTAMVLVHNSALAETVRLAGARDVRLVGTPLPKEFMSTPVRPRIGPIRSIAYIGRLAPEKELDTVVEAARRCPDLQFRLAGDGPLRASLEEEARRLPNLELLGWLSRTRVLDLLDESDLLVLPSRMETFGTVALEAMARERPVIVSRHCGIVHWDELSGGYYRIEEGETLTDAIGRIGALAAKHRHRVARTARTAALRLNQQAIDHWLDVIERLAEV